MVRPQRVFTNSDGLKAISALPERVYLSGKETRSGLWQGLLKKAGGVKGGDWLSAKDVRSE